MKRSLRILALFFVLSVSLFAQTDSSPVTILSTSSNTTGSSYAAGNADIIGLFVEWGTGVSAGTITFEGAATSDYSGTWSTITTLTYSSGSPKVDTDAVEGSFAFVRARSTSLAGGAVVVKMKRRLQGK